MKKAIIIGGGPAGLTAAYELLKKTDIKPIIIEADSQVGGLSKTVNYNGNLIDLGGHRFFSKSDTILNWWLNILPLQKITNKNDLTIAYQHKFKTITAEDGIDPRKEDCVMLFRDRLSRIYYHGYFFDYPLSIKKETFLNLGVKKTARIGFSYAKAKLFPIKSEETLEDFFINRFGRELYKTFFKGYTEKVWGISCRELSAEWGAQRIKTLSLYQISLNALQNILKKGGILQKKQVETSLIERFLYPKFGPGQMWEETARIVQEKGGEIILKTKAKKIIKNGNEINAIEIERGNGQKDILAGDYFFSTMPIKEMILTMSGEAPNDVVEVARGLNYRDFMVVGLLLKKMTVASGRAPDTWIYVHDDSVKVGRVQIFNNWSPYLTKNNEDTVWLGLEYFCNENDDFWQKKDEELKNLAIRELTKIGLASADDLIDGVVLRVKKAYPAYTGSYKNFDLIKNFLNNIENLFPIGRNGMHRYNNQDHSMLTAIAAVDNIVKNVKDKSNIWEINTDQEYHEEK